MAVSRAGLLAAAGWAALAVPAVAQAQPPIETRIEADTGTLSLGTQVTRAGPIHTIDGGTRAGANLFHSFSRFSVGGGDTARFVAANPAGIANLVSRVTGGDPTAIFGTIDSSAIPNADFWLINPAGILVGAGARLNVPAAVHLTSASRLGFESGPDFAVTTPGGSILSVAAPAAFGFVGSEGAVGIFGAGRELLPDRGARLVLVGVDAGIFDSNLAAGRFVVAAVGAQPIDLPFAAADTAAFTGTATIASSVLRLNGVPGGTEGIRIGGGIVDIARSDLGTDFVAGPDQGVSGPIRIRGDDITIFNSLVSASTFGAEAAAPIEIVGGKVLITANSFVSNDARLASSGAAGQIGISGESIVIEELSRISSSTQTAQDGGGIVIQGGDILLSRSVIASDTLPTATGNAGGIILAGDSLALEDGMRITSSTGGAGNAGAIFIEILGPISLSGSFIDSRAAEGSSGGAGLVGISAASLALLDQSGISTTTFGSGAGGLIGIDAADIFLDQFSRVESQSSAEATGNAGAIAMEGERLTVTGGATIASDTFGVGQGGGIDIEVGDIEISAGGSISSDTLIECVAEPCARGGDAGGIVIRADRLAIFGSDEFASAPARAISSDALSTGNAGAIGLTLGTLEMDGKAFISSDTFGSGLGGIISIEAANVTLRNQAFVSTGAYGAGQGGTIALDVGNLLIEDDASIRSQSRSQQGAAGGRIAILADRTTIRRAEINSAGLGNGDAGSVEIASGRIELDAGAILSDTQGAGRGGDIALSGNEIVLRNGSLIASDSLGCFSFCDSIGDAGSVTINARSLSLLGAEGELDLIRSRISSETLTEGDAGDIVLRVGRLTMDIGAISSSTGGPGDAGTIDIEADDASLANFSRIETLSSPPCPDGVCTPAGDAGSVLLVARGDVTLTGFSAILSNSFADGDAGAVEIVAATLSLQRSRITTASEIGATGRSGNIGIEADALLLTDGSEVSSEASNSLPAGRIAIEAGRILLQDPLSLISSANNENGAAGQVFIRTGGLDLVEGGIISTSSLEGPAGDIVILMPQDGLLRLVGRRFGSAITTSSGPGTGGLIVISNPYAILSDGGSILALGEQGGANVQIQTGFFIRSADRRNRVAVDGDFLLEAQVGDVSSGTVERDLSILDASGVLRGQCAAARSSGQVSQLVVRPVGPYGQGGVGRSTTGAPCS
jgi:filamentous hemagglutinin family protein